MSYDILYGVGKWRCFLRYMYSSNMRFPKPKAFDLRHLRHKALCLSQLWGPLRPWVGPYLRHLSSEAPQF